MRGASSRRTNPSAAPEGSGGTTLERHAAPARVHEAQTRGVQADALEGVAAAAVGAVADDRVVQVRELGADLATAAGDELELEQRGVLEALQHAVARDGFAAPLAVAGRANA